MSPGAGDGVFRTAMSGVLRTIESEPALDAAPDELEDINFVRAMAKFFLSSTASSFSTRRFHAVSFATRDIL